MNGFWQSKIFLLKDILLKKELPITTTTCLSLVKEGPQSYCLKVYLRSSVNQMWILKNFNDFLVMVLYHYAICILFSVVYYATYWSG